MLKIKAINKAYNFLDKFDKNYCEYVEAFAEEIEPKLWKDLIKLGEQVDTYGIDIIDNVPGLFRFNLTEILSVPLLAGVLAMYDDGFAMGFDSIEEVYDYIGEEVDEEYLTYELDYRLINGKWWYFDLRSYEYNFLEELYGSECY